MRERIRTVLLVLIGVGSTAAACAQDGWVAPVPIGGEDVQAVEPVRRLIDEIGGRVVQCRASGGEHVSCLCRQKGLHEDLRKAVETVLARHPEWKEGAVSYRVGDESRMVSFVGLSMQFEQFDAQCR